jgi:Tfp pilus assembly protein PilO
MTKMKQMWLFTALAVVAVLALGYFFAISPKRAQVDELHASAEAQRIANKQLDSDIDRLEKQQKTLPAKQTRLAEIALNIPKAPLLPTLTRALTKMSTSSGVDIQSIAPVQPAFMDVEAPAAAPVEPADEVGGDKPKSSPPVRRATSPEAAVGKLALVEIKITGWGSFAEIQEFLIEAEELKRLMVVTNVKIVRGPPEEQEALARPGSVGDLKLEMTVRVFMRKTADQPVLTAPSAGTASAITSGAKSDG